MDRPTNGNPEEEEDQKGCQTPDPENQSNAVSNYSSEAANIPLRSLATIADGNHDEIPENQTPRDNNGSDENDLLPEHVNPYEPFTSLLYEPLPVKSLQEETIEMRNVVEFSDSEGDFILADDLSRELQGMLAELFRDLPLPLAEVEERIKSSLESDPSVVSFPSHASASTNNFTQISDDDTSCEDRKYECPNVNNNSESDDVVSLCSESVTSKIPNGSEEIVLFAEEGAPPVPPPRKITQDRKILYVENKKGDDIWAKYEYHWRALEKRINRNNIDALKVLEKIRSSPSSRSMLDDFEAREKFYRRKHLVSWQAAISMPRTKKIPFETQIPLAATRYLAKRLPKMERLRRRIIKIFACGSNRFYVHEELTQLSIDNFNTTYNSMKASSVLPGFGLMRRMKLFTMRHPKMIERDEIMDYSYRDYIKDNRFSHIGNLNGSMGSSLESTTTDYNKYL